MTCLDPMELALNQVQMLTGSLFDLDIDQKQFRTDYPRLMSTLSKMDVPADERVLLPDDAYRLGHSIWLAFEHLKSTALHSSLRARDEQIPITGMGFDEVGKEIESIRERISKLRSLLKSEYLKSFG